MPKDQTFCAIILGVQTSYIKRININSFITNNDLLDSFALIPENKHVSITNIHLVFLFHQEGRIIINHWALFMYFQHKEAKFFLILICKKIKVTFFMVIDNFLDV